MELTFRAGNQCLDLGWVTNGSCIFHSVILDDREDPDDNEGEAWDLQYRPIALVVHPPDAHLQHYGTICEGMPEGCYPIRPTYEASTLQLPRAMRSSMASPKEIHIRRRGFKIIPCVGGTSFFYQGATVRRQTPTVFDFRIPSGPVTPPSVYVSGSRAETWNQIYLLHQLWPAGDDAAKKTYLANATRKFRYDADTRAVNGYLHKKAQATLERYADVDLHYCTSDHPNTCATCGEAYSTETI